MKKEELEKKDIAGYLSYGLYATSGHGMSKIGFNDLHYMFNMSDDNLKPILRPPSDLCKEITNNGSESFIPIVELAKITSPDEKWLFSGSLNEAFSTKEGTMNYAFGFSKYDCCFYLKRYKDGTSYYAPVWFQSQLFDKLHEWKIDYRKLIEKGQGIDVNTLEFNPYK